MVKIYTTSSCPRCQALKGIFKEGEVPYEEVNIEEDFIARAKLIENDIYQVPALEVNGEIRAGEVEELVKFTNQAK